MSIQNTLFPTAIITLFTISLVYCQPSQKGTVDSTRSSIKGVVDKLVAPLFSGPKRVNGLVVGVIRGDTKEVFGYGDIGQSRGNTPNGETEFKIASVTKPLTALLLAKFVVQGKLALEDPVNQCSSTFSSSLCFNGKPVTFFQLATHTSGLPVVPPNMDQEATEYSMADFRRFLANYSINREPGSRFEYSTVGYAVLGMFLAEKCGVENFESCLAKEVLEPLQMTSTTFDVRGAVGHSKGSITRHRKGRVAFRASGGLWSTTNDLLKLVSANLQPKSHPNLSDAIALTHQTYADIPTFQGSISALGWQFLVAFHAYWHSGVTSDSRAFVTFNLQKNCGVVMLANTGLQATDTRIELAGFSIMAALGSLR
ncbi:MAG: serine hydrolase domain-containing protein [bacterium]